jgi:hypothetical protein
MAITQLVAVTVFLLELQTNEWTLGTHNHEVHIAFKD